MGRPIIVAQSKADASPSPFKTSAFAGVTAPIVRIGRQLSFGKRNKEPPSFNPSFKGGTSFPPTVPVIRTGRQLSFGRKRSSDPPSFNPSFKGGASALAAPVVRLGRQLSFGRKRTSTPPSFNPSASYGSVLPSYSNVNIPKVRTTSLSGQAAGPMGTPTSPVRTASLTKPESSPGRQPSFAKAESVTVTVSPPAVAVDLGKTTTSDEPTSDEPAKADPPAPSAEAEAPPEPPPRTSSRRPSLIKRLSGAFSTSPSNRASKRDSAAEKSGRDSFSAAEESDM